MSNRIVKIEVAEKIYDISKISKEHEECLKELIGENGYNEVLLYKKQDKNIDMVKAYTEFNNKVKLNRVKLNKVKLNRSLE